MGQYYILVVLADKKLDKEIIRMWTSPHIYGDFAKLTEHSYIESKYIQAVEYLISPEGMFYMSRIVWAGDYADSEENEEGNLYSIAKNNEQKMLNPDSFDTTCYRYILNHTKKLYVDKERMPPSQITDTFNKNTFGVIHPLPLLVSEGNGSGGGDYCGNNEELCGTWARDTISVEKTIPDGFEELVCDFY